MFALPLHKKYTTYNYTTGQSIQEISKYDFIIDWGDGSENTNVNVTGNTPNVWDETNSIYNGYPKNFPTAQNPNSIPAIPGCYHIYTTPGKYNISIKSKSTDNTKQYICNCLYTHINDEHTWKNLFAIFSMGELDWKSFENTFCNAKNVYIIPNEDLIQQKDSSNYMILTTSHMFYNCKSIVNIPILLKIHKNLIDLSYMFYNCFSADIDTNGSGFKPSMFPDNGFFNSTTDINVTSMFENCIKMKGELRGRFLWYSPHNTWISDNCFKGCTLLNNYDTIPTNWGGLGKQFPFIFEIKLPKPNNTSWQVTLPIRERLEHFYVGSFFQPSYIYNFTIEWGDGTSNKIKNWQDPNKIHIYRSYGENNSGIFTIKIYGLFEGWDTGNAPPSYGDCDVFKNLIYKIKDWGKTDVIHYKQFCYFCSNLIEIPNTPLPLPLAFHKTLDGGKSEYSWDHMFLSAFTPKNEIDYTTFKPIGANVNLPLVELNDNKNSIISINVGEMFGVTKFTYIPEMFNSENSDFLIKKLNEFKNLGIYIYKSNIFSAKGLTIDSRRQLAERLNSFIGMLSNDNDIRFKLDYTDENEIEKTYQISALVQETTPGSPSSYFIYPRYNADDLIHNKIFMKHPSDYGDSCLWQAFAENQYITKFSDYEFKIIFEDINNKVEFDYKKYITTYDNKDSGMKYVPESFNETTKTFKLSYTGVDGIQYEAIFPFYSMFPSAYIKNGITIPINICDYSNVADCWRKDRYIPFEENVRFDLHAKITRIGWNTAQNTQLIFPNKETLSTYIVNEYTDINGNKISGEFLVSDYYQTLHLKRYDNQRITTEADLLSDKPCFLYDTKTFNKLTWYNELYTKLDPPVKPYLSSLVLDENNRTIGLPGISKKLGSVLGREYGLYMIGGLGYGLNGEFVPSSFVIPPGVIDLSYLFYKWRKLTQLDYPLIIPSSVNSIEFICGNCINLTDLSKLDGSLSNIISLTNAFNNCYKLAKLPTLKYKTSSDINAMNTFNNCRSVIEYTKDTIDIPSSSVVLGGNMFANNYSLKTIPEGLCNLKTNTSYTFSNCSGLTVIPVYAKQLFTYKNDNDNVKALTYLFNNCTEIKTVEDGFTVGSTVVDYSGLFNNCSGLTYIPSAFWPDTYNSDTISVSNICANCISLSSEIPSDKLWGNPAIKWGFIGAFKNCKKIENYDDIPNNWK